MPTFFENNTFCILPQPFTANDERVGPIQLAYLIVSVFRSVVLRPWLPLNCHHFTTTCQDQYLILVYSTGLDKKLRIDESNDIVLNLATDRRPMWT